jgi:steroid delta-isomerase-like uncharacterized protein
MTDGKELIDRWFQGLYNDKDLSVAEEILAEEIRYYGPQSIGSDSVTTRDEVKDFVTQFHENVPNIEYNVEMLFSMDGKYCACWTAEGTQETDLFGMETDSEEFHDRGVNAFVIEDGKIVEIWSYWDTLDSVLGLASEYEEM